MLRVMISSCACMMLLTTLCGCGSGTDADDTESAKESCFYFSGNSNACIKSDDLHGGKISKGCCAYIRAKGKLPPTYDDCSSTDRDAMICYYVRTPKVTRDCCMSHEKCNAELDSKFMKVTSPSYSCNEADDVEFV